MVANVVPLANACPLCLTACRKKIRPKKKETTTKRRRRSHVWFLLPPQHDDKGPRCAAVIPPLPPRSTFGIFGVHLVGGYDRIQSQRGTSKRGCPFPFPGVSVVSPKKMLVDSPEEIAVCPIGREENLEGRGGDERRRSGEDKAVAGRAFHAGAVGDVIFSPR